jgi:hypothetical protein
VPLLFLVETALILTSYSGRHLDISPLPIASVQFSSPTWDQIRIALLKYIADKILLHDSELLWLLAACVADVIITISLVYTLVNLRSEATARLLTVSMSTFL